MMTERKYIDIKEFLEFGYLQELNRQFLHPLGMALEVVVDDDGTERLGNVWDSREDPEGFVFARMNEEQIAECEVKYYQVLSELLNKSESRFNSFGFTRQPVSDFGRSVDGPQT